MENYVFICVRLHFFYYLASYVTNTCCLKQVGNFRNLEYRINLLFTFLTLAIRGGQH